MPVAATTVERQGRTAVVHVHGDIIIPTAPRLHGTLRGLVRQRGIRKVVVDFSDVGRLDSAGVAVLQLTQRALKRSGKELELGGLADHQRAALELAPERAKPVPKVEQPTWLEALGERILEVLGSAREVGRLVAEIFRQSFAVITGRKHLPKHSIAGHVLTMGADAVFIVGLLSFLLGITTAFQGVVQLAKFGAGVFVADMVGWSMIREVAPMMTAIVLCGRTGAAIAAELGTMRVGQEIDALTAMGVSPVRFLVVPRMAALTFALPALTIIAMFIGISGGALVASLLLEMRPSTFWLRISERVDFLDFLQGFLKSFVFAWIIGLTGSHLGMRASGDANSVGAATTRTVVVSIFFIIVVDALFATAATLVKA